MSRQNTIAEFKEAGYCKCIRTTQRHAGPITPGRILHIKEWVKTKDGRKGCVFTKWYYGFIEERHLIKYFRVPSDKEILMRQLK